MQSRRIGAILYRSRIKFGMTAKFEGTSKLGVTAKFGVTAGIGGGCQAICVKNTRKGL